MSDLTPYPFGRLIRRMFHEFEAQRSIFGLPERKFFRGDAARDLSIRLHGRTASSPLGPAAGPHTQMAQNLVLSWLGGARVMELKTVQILDELEIPRPCIDMHNVGFNVEWSQELKLEQSLEEYVKGAMLIRILEASGLLALSPGFDQVLFDMSVGYNLEGIKSPGVQRFLAGMREASEVVERLRAEIPEEYKQFRKLDFPTCLSNTLTLSTFHGCPPEEIESIATFLLKDMGLNTVVKLNPTLLGPKELRHLLHEVMGYDDIVVPDSAFDRDPSWTQVVGMVERLGALAATLKLSFGVKFTNTLIVENNRNFFPASAKEMYLSGPPLHVLAINLVHKFRGQFGDRFPVSFSAGIDRSNFPDAVAMGLVPITVCSDLLKTGGYGRLEPYFRELGSRMKAVGASDIDDFIIRANGLGLAALEQACMRGATDEAVEKGVAACREALEEGGNLLEAAGPELYARWVSVARLLNTAHYVELATQDPRYAKVKNSKSPRKVGSQLELLDCLTCDKCIPVCPNNAVFSYTLPKEEVSLSRLELEGASWKVTPIEPLKVDRKHQLATFADFCNECGNCDVFCPEDGGPYRKKARFFSSHEAWREAPEDGFYLERKGEAQVTYARIAGEIFELRLHHGKAWFRSEGVNIRVLEDSPETVLAGTASRPVDLRNFHVMRLISRAILEGEEVNYLNTFLIEA